MADGNCEARKRVQCALDAYLLLIVDAVEEATGRKFDRTRVAGPTCHPSDEISRTAEVRRQVYLDLTSIS
jgi:hypothetical protein